MVLNQQANCKHKQPVFGKKKLIKLKYYVQTIVKGEILTYKKHVKTNIFGWSKVFKEYTYSNFLQLLNIITVKL